MNFHFILTVSQSYKKRHGLTKSVDQTIQKAKKYQERQPGDSVEIGADKLAQASLVRL